MSDEYVKVIDEITDFLKSVNEISLDYEAEINKLEGLLNEIKDEPDSSTQSDLENSIKESVKKSANLIYEGTQDFAMNPLLRRTYAIEKKLIQEGKDSFVDELSATIERLEEGKQATGLMEGIVAREFTRGSIDIVYSWCDYAKYNFFGFLVDDLLSEVDDLR